MFYISFLIHERLSADINLLTCLIKAVEQNQEMRRLEGQRLLY